MSVVTTSVAAQTLSAAAPPHRRRLDSALRSVAATVGTLPIALSGSASLARFLPFSPDAAFAIGYVALIPIWITAMCCAFLAKSGARSLAICVVLAAVLAGALLVL